MTDNIQELPAVRKSQSYDSLTPETVFCLNDSDSIYNEIATNTSLKASLNLRRAPTLLLKTSRFSLLSTPTPPTTVNESIYFDINKIPLKPIPFHKPDSDSETSKPTNLVPKCRGSNCYIHTGEFAGMAVAVKSIANRSVDSTIVWQEFVDEINLLSRIRHPHIINLLHYYEEEVIESITKPVMVLEMLQGGTLRQYLDRKRPFHAKVFSKLRYMRIARELASALHYLHNEFSSDCVLIHRDLKPDNIGFTESGALKLFDFGLCVAVPRSMVPSTPISSEGSSDSPKTYSMTGQTGSPRYMAPEVALGQEYNQSVDIYSYSIILHEIITGEPCFRGVPLARFQEMIVQEKKRPGLEHDDYGRALHLHPRLCSLLTQGWSSVVTERPSADSMLATITEIETELKQRDQNKPFIFKVCKYIFRRRDSI